MPKVQTSCPRCKSPVIADLEQLLDVSVDPSVKQRLLSGQVNVIHCPTCGFEGMVSAPLVYHDPEKELLLTYFPPELGLSVNDQERLIGPLINQITNRLPLEKRKAYLLRPQTMLTFQTLIERILEADGITREVLENQQKRFDLIQRLVGTASPEDRKALMQQNEGLIDADFFLMLSQITEAMLAQGDERTARVLAALQQEALNNTKTGLEIKNQTQEVQDILQKLQQAGRQGLTREKLLDLMLEARSEAALTALVGLVHNGLDYEFFQALTERIETAQEETEKERLQALRTKLLEYARQIDEQIQRRYEQSRRLVQQIASAPNIEQTVEESLEAIDEFFLKALDEELEQARKSADLNRISRLQRIRAHLEKLSAPPPEVAFLEELLRLPSYQERQKKMQEHAELVTGEFLQLVSGLIAQGEKQSQPPELLSTLREINRIALRMTMMANLNQ
ncbi:CpXC domain-containing protein [uncultured Thermanaerothrix sp.]|uniref:CpXC domain-containing protein n=1 Tax=uncultured Thermanaerothrix sp. TaxID=1195149 RepID=UPI0026357C13|nr:CpXC domain-containing protein [uncultured Thermanaerothrix sp.]